MSSPRANVNTYNNVNSLKGNNINNSDSNNKNNKPTVPLIPCLELHKTVFNSLLWADVEECKHDRAKDGQKHSV